MPDSPAERRAQLSSLPSPSEVTTPYPVTTTIGRPALSFFAAISSPSAGGFHQRQALAPPMADAGHDHLVDRAFGRRLDSRFIPRREELTTADDGRGQRNIHGKLRLHGMADIGAGRP